MNLTHSALGEACPRGAAATRCVLQLDSASPHRALRRKPGQARQGLDFEIYTCAWPTGTLRSDLAQRRGTSQAVAPTCLLPPGELEPQRLRHSK